MNCTTFCLGLIVAFLLSTLPSNANKDAVTRSSQNVKAEHVPTPETFSNAFFAEDGSPPIDGPIPMLKGVHGGVIGPKVDSVPVPETRLELPKKLSYPMDCVLELLGIISGSVLAIIGLKRLKERKIGWFSILLLALTCALTGPAAPFIYEWGVATFDAAGKFQ
jgi:hypothetical protein